MTKEKTVSEANSSVAVASLTSQVGKWKVLALEIDNAAEEPGFVIDDEYLFPSDWQGA